MSDQINVAVLGPIPRDNITSYQGEKFEKFGCAVYTAACMSSLAGPGSRVNVVSHVRKADIGKVQELLSAFPHINAASISDAADQGAVIDLIYLDSYFFCLPVEIIQPPPSPYSYHQRANRQKYHCVSTCIVFV